MNINFRVANSDFKKVGFSGIEVAADVPNREYYLEALNREPYKEKSTILDKQGWTARITTTKKEGALQAVYIKDSKKVGTAPLSKPKTPYVETIIADALLQWKMLKRSLKNSNSPITGVLINPIKYEIKRP
jgi:hypothetical protein